MKNGGAIVTTGERRERRGFASMSPEKQREIASKGGRAAHEKGTAHEWTADEARSAGRKGGQVSRGSLKRRSGERRRSWPCGCIGNARRDAGWRGAVKYRSTALGTSCGRRRS